MDPVIFVHLTVPIFVLWLNLYVIMLDDEEEEKFFKHGKKGSAGKGIFLVNFALIATFLALCITAYLRFVVNSKASRTTFQPADASDYDPEYDDSISQQQEEMVVFIEECLMHGLGVVQAVTLREYARAKMKDISNFRKKK